MESNPGNLGSSPVGYNSFSLLAFPYPSQGRPSGNTSSGGIAASRGSKKSTRDQDY